MNTQQKAIIETYTNLKVAVENLLNAPNQEDFCNRMPDVANAQRDLLKLEGRGCEQWIYNLKLTAGEYQEVIEHLKSQK